ncbi:hypothetical protein Bca4012_007452 [Brassica carinata]
MEEAEDWCFWGIRPITISTNFKSDPEVVCTVWSTVFMNHDGLSPGDSFLVNGGSSGIVKFEIQMAKHKD